MEELFQYARTFLAIEIVQIFILIGIFVGAVVIANNTASKEETENKCADVRLVYCLGHTRDEKAGKWFTTGKIYVVIGTHIIDDQGYDWDCFYIRDKGPHIKKVLDHQFYIM